jgi:hypothetical protein
MVRNIAMSTTAKAWAADCYVSDRVFNGVRRVTDKAKIDAHKTRVKNALEKIAKRTKA